MNFSPELNLVQQEYIRRITQGNAPILLEVEHFLASTPGKMIRPKLTLMSAATLAPTISQRTLLMAVAVEMLHNVSLLHDDVVDNSPTRRGLPSVANHWGNATAVLVGDYLLAQLMQLLHEIDDKQASSLIANTVVAMSESELYALQSAPSDAASYLRILDGKTARLMATSCALGNPMLEKFGLHYGRFFQLRDDIADGEATPWTAPLVEQERDAALSELARLSIPDSLHQSFSELLQ